MTPSTHVLYECGICGSLHPWDWDGDCRDDANRFGDELDYLETHPGVGWLDLEIRSWAERCEADDAKIGAGEA